jgi:transcriptional regulator with XRE-family HTH domain
MPPKPRLRLNNRKLVDLSRKALGRGRKDPDPTNAEIAQLLGVEQSTIHRIFNGERNPGSDFLAVCIDKFAELLSWSHGDVFAYLFNVASDTERRAS